MNDVVKELKNLLDKNGLKNIEKINSGYLYRILRKSCTEIERLSLENSQLNTIVNERTLENFLQKCSGIILEIQKEMKDNNFIKAYDILLDLQNLIHKGRWNINKSIDEYKENN